MAVLVTGATGFVMSVLARQWLEEEPNLRLVALDTAPLDASAQRYFAPIADRLEVVVADVTRPESWAEHLDTAGITHVVHGATVTPLARGTAADTGREPEADDPARIIRINVMGTVAVLDWARMQPNMKRVIYVSSGAVYKHHGPDRPGEPLPEYGYVMPRRLHGISKLTSELITERHGDLFGISTASVRFSSVYGTMDRATASRNFRHVRIRRLRAVACCASTPWMRLATTSMRRMWPAGSARSAPRPSYATAPITSPPGRPRPSVSWSVGRRKSPWLQSGDRAHRAGRDG